MNRLIHFFIISMLILPLAGCLQSPKDRLAATGEDTCVAMNDVFNLGSGGLIVVDTSRPDVGITSWIVERIDNVMDVASRVVFLTLVGDGGGTAGNPAFLDIFNTLIALTIAIFSLSVLLGIQQATGYNVAMFILKIVFVWLLGTNYDLFNTYVIDPIETFIADLSSVFANVFSEGVRIPGDFDTPPSTENNVLNFVDQTITTFFSSSFWRVILATITSGWTGAIYGILLLFVVISYMFATIEAVKVYIVAMIVRALLFSLAPIFLIFLLFKQTKSMFDGWMDQVISYSLQPIFLMAFLGMFQLIFIGFLAGIIPASAANQKVCYGVWLEISGWLPYLYSERIGDGSQESPYIAGSDADMPFNIWIIISLLLITMIMRSMVKWSVEVAARLGSGFISAFDVPLAGWDSAKQSILGGAGAGAGSVASRLKSVNYNR